MFSFLCRSFLCLNAQSLVLFSLWFYSYAAPLALWEWSTALPHGLESGFDGLFPKGDRKKDWVLGTFSSAPATALCQMK